MPLITFSLLSWYVVLCAKFMWESWRSQRIMWQMLGWIQVGIAAEFFSVLANLFGPDDRHDPPDDRANPWPQAPEENRPETMLIFECSLEGQSRLVQGRQR